MKKLLAILLALSMVLSLAACSSSGTDEGDASGGDTGSTESDVIKIGVFEPLTGANAGGGELEVKGIEMAHAQYPEVLGKKIELVKVDNKSDAVEASTAAHKLVEEDKVDIVIGSWGSTLSNAGGDAFKDAQIIAMGASCTNPNVTANNPYYYRVCFIDPFQGTVLANYAYDTLKATKVGILYEVSNDYAVGLRNFFKEAFTAKGGTITAEQTYQTNDTDFTAQLQTLMKDNPDVIFAPGNYTEAALMMQQVHQMGYDSIQFMGGDTYEVPELVQVGGADVEGVIFSTFFDPEAPLNETTTAFIEAYKAENNGAAPAAFTALGYDAYLTVYKAIEAAGSTDTAAIQAALATITVQGVTGDIAFDATGDAIKNLAIVKTVENGNFVFKDKVEIK